MKQRIIRTALILCVAFIAASTVDAQNQRTGTSAAPELLIPVGGRDLALGGSSIAISQGVEAIHWNPAGLARMSHSTEGMFSSMSYIADINMSYGAVATQFEGFGTVGLSLRSLDFGEIPVTTVEDEDGVNGGTFSPTYVTIGLTYSRQVTDAVSVGGTAKLVSESIARVSATGMAFDLGLQYSGLLGVKGIQMGITVKNIGTSMQFDGTGLLRSATSSDGSRPEQPYKSEAASFELPSLIEIGLTYSGSSEDNSSLYSISGSYTNNNLYLDQYRVGGEYGYAFESAKIFGRAGYELVPQLDDVKDNVFGLTLGAGITYNTGGVDLTFDYAFRKAEFFDNNNVFSLKVGF
jgi:hypothetical protein